MYSSDVSAGDDIIDSQYNNLRKDILPVGAIVGWAGSFFYPPTGWLICDGSEVSRTTYATLYALIGDTFGAGDGLTTFNLPDCTDKYILGVKTGTYNLGTTGGANTHAIAEAELPAHTHVIVDTGTSHTHTVTTKLTGWAGGTTYVDEELDLKTYYQYSVVSTYSHNHGGVTGNFGQASPTALDISPTYQKLNFIINSGLSSDVASGDTFWASQMNNVRQEMGTQGLISLFTTGVIPTGWILCDGSAIDRTTYADLFDIIGTTFGVGDGSTTFNVPNLADSFIRGAIDNTEVGDTGSGSKTLVSANIPEHNHTIATQSNHTHYTGTTDSASGRTLGTVRAIFVTSSASTWSAYQNTSSDGAHDHTGNTNNEGSTTAFTVLPKYLALAYMIRY